MKCPLCNAHTMKVAYSGNIRTGITADIVECRVCKAQMYADALKIGDYQSGKYRDEVGHEQHGHTIDYLIPFKEFNGKTVLDIGAGDGRYMDLCASHGANVIGIEPDYRELQLLSRYPMYDSLESAKDVRADIILCLTVIEHVENPIEFLRQAGNLLKDGGRMIVSTPNRESLLMKLLDFDFCAWFYRPAHRWYWDQFSLAQTFAMAGLQPTMNLTFDPYGFSNFIHWLKEKKPGKNWKCGLDDLPMDFALRMWTMDQGLGFYLLNIVTKGKVQ